MKGKHIYMVGIGGIGMSALAQLLKHRGAHVSGSDREASPTTELLGQKGINVSIGHDGCLIPADTELLIYSDAVWADNPERMRASEMKIPEMSYFHALGEVSRGTKHFLAVAGTHGKTTTTGMTAAILKAAGKQPTAVVGSIVQDFGLNGPEGTVGRTQRVLGSNFLAGDNDLFVVEACEYRNHMLELEPNILVVTNIEHDHTDFFPTLESFQESFRHALEKVPASGHIVTNPYDPNITPLLLNVKAKVTDYTKVNVPHLQLVGEFNAMNARAAKAAALAAFPDISEQVIDDALAHFKGSWRRWEHKGETAGGATVYDDYAHHPTAIEKTIAAAREKFPDKKLTVVFHPHLYSRTRDLFDGFVRSLAQADSVILVPIYPAREIDTGEVSSDKLAEFIRPWNANVQSLHSFAEIRDELERTKGEHDLIITMGAGDVYKIAEEITER